MFIDFAVVFIYFAMISIDFLDRAEPGAATGAGPEAGPGPSPAPIVSRASTGTMVRETVCQTCFYCFGLRQVLPTQNQ